MQPSPDNEYQPDARGTRTYLIAGIAMLVASTLFNIIAVDGALKTGLNIQNVLSGGSAGQGLWPVVLAQWSNILLYLGLPMVLLSVLFDLMHRFRDAKPRA